jgi:hypothetical protein
MKQQNSVIARKRPNPKFIEHDIKYYHWALFKQAIEFLKQCARPKKTTSKILLY